MLLSRWMIGCTLRWMEDLHRRYNDHWPPCVNSSEKIWCFFFFFFVNVYFTLPTPPHQCHCTIFAFTRAYGFWRSNTVEPDPFTIYWCGMSSVHWTYWNIIIRYKSSRTSDLLWFTDPPNTQGKVAEHKYR